MYTWISDGGSLSRRSRSRLFQAMISPRGLFARVLANPIGNCVVGRAGGNKGSEIIVGNLGKFEPPLVQRAVGMILTLHTGGHRPAFIQCPGRQDIAGQCLAGTAGIIPGVPQVRGQQFYFFEILIYDNLFRGAELNFRASKPRQRMSGRSEAEPGCAARCAIEGSPHWPRVGT